MRSSFRSVGLIGGEGDLVDLPISGCGIESVTDVQPGASLEIRIMTKAHESPLQIQQAIVRWKQGRQFGLEFVTMGAGEWARLQQIEMEPYEWDNQAATMNESS